MKMMLNDSELEEELEDTWERVLDRYEAPRLSIMYEEPSRKNCDGTWVWMEANGYNLLSIKNGVAYKLETYDLDELLFKTLLPCIKEIAMDLDGDPASNEINICSTLGERWEKRMISEQG
jgi:hypothetical protein